MDNARIIEAKYNHLRIKTTNVGFLEVTIGAFLSGGIALYPPNEVVLYERKEQKNTIENIPDHGSISLFGLEVISIILLLLSNSATEPKGGLKVTMLSMRPPVNQFAGIGPYRVLRKDPKRTGASAGLGKSLAGENHRLGE